MTITVLTERFDNALTYARVKHPGARKVDPDDPDAPRIPYLAHLLATTSLVLEMGGSEDEAIAALLHDVVEDAGGEAAELEIRARFGDVVARIVRACSDTDQDPKPPWRARKEAYIAAIAHKERGELMVSLADKIHNARSILYDLRVCGPGFWRRFTTGDPLDQLWYYQALADAFDARRKVLAPNAEPMVDELRRVVGAIAGLVASSGEVTHR